MDPSIHYRSQDLADLIQLTEIYNTQQEVVTAKNMQNEDALCSMWVEAPLKIITLGKIKEIVQKFSSDPNLTKENAIKIKSVIKRIRFYYTHLDLWKQITEKMNVISKIASPKPQTELTAKDRLPFEIWLEIAKSLDKKDTLSLRVLYRELGEAFVGPIGLSYFLEKFSSEISPEVKFKLARKYGKDLVHLDLSNFRELDDKMLETLLVACPELRSLNLSNTIITKLNLPDKLTDLNISYCNFIKPEEFEKLNALSQLRTFNASHTHIEKITLSPNHLEELDLSWCGRIEPEEFKKLKAFSKLRTFNASRTNIQKIKLSPNHLEELDVAWCKKIEPKEFKKLNAFLQLKTFIASYTQIKKITILPKQLREIDVTDCRNIQPGEFENLNDFSQLRTFNASSTNIQKITMSPNSLEKLDLTWCGRIETEEFNKLRAFSKLKTFNAGETKIVSLQTLPQGIKVLTLNGCNRIPTNQFDELVNFPLLEKLSAEDTKIEKVGNLPNSLLELNLNGCGNLRTVDNLPNRLLELNLNRCDNLRTVDNLPNSLLKLNLNRCYNLQSITFCNQTSRLSFLDISECRSIKKLSNLPKRLNVLFLKGTSFPVEEFESLSQLSQLKKLVLSQTNIQKLSTLPLSLIELELFSYSIPANEYDHLGKLVNLKYLRVHSFGNFEKLPPNLRTFQINVSTTTPEQQKKILDSFYISQFIDINYLEFTRKKITPLPQLD